MQTKHTTKIIKGYKRHQKFIKETLVKYITPLLSVYIH